MTGCDPRYRQNRAFAILLNISSVWSLFREILLVKFFGYVKIVCDQNFFFKSRQSCFLSCFILQIVAIYGTMQLPELISL